MLTQDQINRLEEQFYNEFILRRNLSIKSIGSSYDGAAEYLHEAIIDGIRLYGRDEMKVLNYVDQAIVDTVPTIESEFHKQYRLNAAAVLAGMIILARSGLFDLNTDHSDALNATTRFEVDDAPRMFAGKVLADRIWGNDRQIILEGVLFGIRKSTPAATLASRVETYIVDKKGKDRTTTLSYGEMTRINNAVKVALYKVSAPWMDEEVGIEQGLSPAHKEPDICDVLAGVYKLGTEPPCPRHVKCNCWQRLRILRNVRTTTYGEQIQDNQEFIEKHKVRPLEEQ